MRPTVILVLIAALLLLGVVAAQDEPKGHEGSGMPEAPTRLPEHIWLDQLVGEWAVTMEATMGPGTEPQRFESTESARSIGGFWVVGEGRMTMEGQTMSSMLTVGYDPAKKTFVGTWIDTMHIRLWVYTGTLDEEKKTLSLIAEGPDFEDPTKTRRYRDAIEIVGPDHKRLTSSMQDEDGTWTQFMQADYRRKK